MSLETGGTSPDNFPGVMQQRAHDATKVHVKHYVWLTIHDSRLDELLLCHRCVPSILNRFWEGMLTTTICKC